MTNEFDGHTPGPWLVSRALRPSDGEYDWGIGGQIEGQIYCIAEAFGRVATDVRPNAEANARLIAAAPDLLRQRDEMLAFLRNIEASSFDASIKSRIRAFLAGAQDD